MKNILLGAWQLEEIEAIAEALPMNHKFADIICHRLNVSLQIIYRWCLRSGGNSDGTNNQVHRDFKHHVTILPANPMVPRFVFRKLYSDIIIKRTNRHEFFGISDRSIMEEGAGSKAFL